MNRRELCLGVSALTFVALTPGLALAADAALEKAVANPKRTAANALRDPARHPIACLTFWGLKPGMTVVEIDPGKPGYWQEIVQPYVEASGGHYIAAAIPFYRGEGPNAPLSMTSGPIAPAGTADMVLTARNIHNMMWQPGMLAKMLKDFNAVLKPGGILAVEEHRADPTPQVDTPRPANTGYVAVANVVNACKAAGFVLEAQSEINANPKDTKDYYFGVWTLKPSREDSEPGKPTPPNWDRAKYDAIGESDRMTLRFRKA